MQRLAIIIDLQVFLLYTQGKVVLVCQGELVEPYSMESVSFNLLRMT